MTFWFWGGDELLDEGVWVHATPEQSRTAADLASQSLELWLNPLPPKTYPEHVYQAGTPCQEHERGGENLHSHEQQTVDRQMKYSIGCRLMKGFSILRGGDV